MSKKVNPLRIKNGELEIDHKRKVFITVYNPNDYYTRKLYSTTEVSDVKYITNDGLLDSILVVNDIDKLKITSNGTSITVPVYDGIAVIPFTIRYNNLDGLQFSAIKRPINIKGVIIGYPRCTALPASTQLYVYKNTVTQIKLDEKGVAKFTTHNDDYECECCKCGLNTYIHNVKLCDSCASYLLGFMEDL